MIKEKVEEDKDSKSDWKPAVLTMSLVSIIVVFFLLWETYEDLFTLVIISNWLQDLLEVKETRA